MADYKLNISYEAKKRLLVGQPHVLVTFSSGRPFSKPICMKQDDLWREIVSPGEFEEPREKGAWTSWDDDGNHSRQLLNSVFPDSKVSNYEKFDAGNRSEQLVEFGGDRHVVSIYTDHSAEEFAGGMTIMIRPLDGNIAKASNVGKHVACYLEQFRIAVEEKLDANARATKLRAGFY